MGNYVDGHCCHRNMCVYAIMTVVINYISTWMPSGDVRVHIEVSRTLWFGVLATYNGCLPSPYGI